MDQAMSIWVGGDNSHKPPFHGAKKNGGEAKEVAWWLEEGTNVDLEGVTRLGSLKGTMEAEGGACDNNPIICVPSGDHPALHLDIK